MQENKNKILVFFASLICFIIGVAAALALFYHFVSKTPEMTGETEKPKKDTMLVKLIDQVYPPSMAAPVIKDKVSSDTGIKKQKYAEPEKIVNAKIKLPPQAGRILLKNNPPAIETSLLEKKASALSNTSVLKNVFSREVCLSLLIALLIMLVAFFSKKEQLINAQRTDKDPPDLQQLFSDFEDQIGNFRNPRKILRFMNLVKYHYYFLNKNDCGGIDNLRKLMWILLEIQKDPSLMSIEGVDTGELSAPAWFYKRIKEKPWYVSSGINQNDDDLMMIILKLNIDMGS